MSPSVRPEPSSVLSEPLMGIARGGKLASRFLVALGVAMAAFGAYLHFHFHAAMQEVASGAPNVAGAFIVAGQAEISSVGTALFFFGFCLVCIATLFGWLGVVAEAQLAGIPRPASSASVQNDASGTTGA
jgi:hypothetical protein